MVNVVPPNPVNSTHFTVGGGESLSQHYENVDTVQMMENTRDQLNYDSQQYNDQLRQDHFEEDQGFQQPYDQDQVDQQRDVPEFVEDNPEFDEHGEVKPKPNKRRKKSKDRRFDDLTRNYHLEREEKEEIRRQNERLKQEIEDREQYKIEAERLAIENRAMVIKLEQKEIQENINKVSELMMQAEQDNDAEARREGAKLMAKLSARETTNERLFEEIQERYKELSKKPVKDPNRDQLNQRIREIHYQQSDPRDLESDHYYGFLKDVPWFNPENTKEYDPDLADEMVKVKKKFNRSLKLNGEADYIGTVDYYEDLKDRFHEEMANEGVISKPKRSKRQDDYEDDYQQYDEDYGDDDMRSYTTMIDANHDAYMRDDGKPNMMFSDPSNARQNSRTSYERMGPRRMARDEHAYHDPRGYQNQRPASNPNLSPGYRGGGSVAGRQPQNLPNLTRMEYDTALRSEMRDPNNPYRKLTAEERVQQWRIEKAKQNWSRAGGR